MKIALCFMISYSHDINKEDLWREWIEYNKDIINIYIHYKDRSKIKSPWILEHAIPEKFVVETSYYHVVPAYMSLLSYAYCKDSANQWFCLVTESCVPIISPQKFRELFFAHYRSTIMRWKYAWWNTDFHKRANLRLLPPELRLGHEPWFVICRTDLNICINYSINQSKAFKLVCDGGLANESIFAIILKHANKMRNVCSEVTTVADWTRMAGPTSPHLFIEGNETDVKFIADSMKENKYAMFLRKVDLTFPDGILREYMFPKSENNTSYEFYYLFKKYLFLLFLFGLCISFLIFN